MRLAIAFAVSFATLSSCAVATDPEDYSDLSDLELCQHYAVTKSRLTKPWTKAAMDELIRRKAVTEAEIADISKEVIRIGMREHAAVCSWGPYKDVNTSVGSWGRHRQYVMGDFGPYVYTENGRVTSWQD